MQSFGFSTVIVSNDDFREDTLINTFSVLQMHGFRKIIFAVSHDISSVTVTTARHIERKKLLQARLSKLSLYGVSTSVVSNVLMSGFSVYERQISRLSLRGSQYLPMELPLFDCKDWIDPTLNYLLYKLKKKPLFISFDRNIATYDGALTEHLMNTRLATFMLDMNSMTNPSMLKYVKSLIDANAIIIPGISGVIEDYTCLYDKFLFLQQALGNDDYAKMIMNSSRGCRAIF